MYKMNKNVIITTTAESELVHRRGINPNITAKARPSDPKPAEQILLGTNTST